jgi:hypothetical protein
MVGYLPSKVQLALRSNDQFINMRMVFIQATYAYKIPPPAVSKPKTIFI